MDNNKNLVIALNRIVGLRKEERSIHLKACSRILTNYLVRNNHTYFKRDLLISMFNDEVKATARNKVIKELLNILIDSKKIYSSTLKRNSKPFLRVRALSCMDDESYKVMMAKNGFRVVDFYKWEYDFKRRIPLRVKVDSKPLGEDSLKSFDFSVLRNTIPRSKQKVLSNSVKSMTLTRSQNNIKVFRLGQRPQDKTFKFD